MRIGLIDFDGKIPNLALMRLSSFYKRRGCEVFFQEIPSKIDQVFCSVVFKQNRAKAARLAKVYKTIAFGGTGWDLKSKLPPEVEASPPDYTLYTPEFLYPRMRGIGTREKKMHKARDLAAAGVGRTTISCVRSCPFCSVPIKEPGGLRQVGEIDDLINPLSGSDKIILLDNNLAADPLVIPKLERIRELGLTVDITQGIDLRCMDEPLAEALGSVKHWRSVHHAWDLMASESRVLRGIDLLSRHIARSRQLCFMLTNFDTSFPEDFHRFRTLVDRKIDPYVMIHDKGVKDVSRLKFHFARWVNGRIYKVCEFRDYDRWVRDREVLTNPTQPELFA